MEMETWKLQHALFRKHQMQTVRARKFMFGLSPFSFEESRLVYKKFWSLELKSMKRKEFKFWLNWIHLPRMRWTLCQSIEATQRDLNYDKSATVPKNDNVGSGDEKYGKHFWKRWKDSSTVHRAFKYAFTNFIFSSSMILWRSVYQVYH